MVTKWFMLLNLSPFVTLDGVTNSGYNHHYIRGEKKVKLKELWKCHDSMQVRHRFVAAILLWSKLHLNFENQSR